MPPKTQKLNSPLRQQRLLKGWTLERLANEIYELCLNDPRAGSRGDINAQMISKWETGKYPPSLYYQEKLSVLYGKSIQKLGFVEEQDTSTPSTTAPTSSTSPTLILNHSTSTQNIDAVLNDEVQEPELLAAKLLSLSGKQLAILTAAGWTLQDVTASLHTILEGEAVLAKINRKQQVQEAKGIIDSIPQSIHKNPSAEERIEMSRVLGESIARGWSLLHTASTPQVLAIGHTQLNLIKDAHYILYPDARSFHYSGIYRLIGAAHHFQGRYEEARRSHRSAYAAALEGGDMWNMAQSLMWQADGLKEQQQYVDALQTIDSALRLASQRNDIESLRLQAHLHSTGAENAALMKDEKEVYKRLAASEALLEHLSAYPLHEEFDRASWLQQAGACNLILGNSDIAAKYLEQTLSELPSQWTLRHATALIPLVIAYAHNGQREAVIETTQKAVRALQALNSPTMTKQFLGYIDGEVLGMFPKDQQLTVLAKETHQRLSPA